jgi:hypothetical protein
VENATLNEAGGDRAARGREWIGSLSSIPTRFAGTHAEHESAERIGEWMRTLGVSDVRLTPLPAHPRAGWSLGLHAAVGALGVWWGGLGGAVLAIVAAWSFRREVRWRRLLLSKLLPAATSVNVIGRAGAAAPTRRVVLSAHIDTAQAGLIFRRELADMFARFQTRSGGEPPGPLAVPEALLIGGAVIAVAAWLGAHGSLFGLARLLDALGLLIAAVLGLQWAASPATPGANDNASAVAAMLTCAETLLADLPADVELCVAGVGAEEVGCNGMHALVEAHREWPLDQTYFINFECVGGGTLHFIRSEGMLRKVSYPSRLVELARRVAAGGTFGAITATDLLAATDGHVPADVGYPTLSLISLEANGVPRNYHRMEDTVDSIDMSTVVRAADFAAAVAQAALHGAAGPIGRNAQD